MPGSFTTNYDPAIEVFCEQNYERYHLCDGFEYDPTDRHNYWHRSVFDNYKLAPGKRNVVLFKLHGSVDWIQVKHSSKIRRGQAMSDVMDSDAYQNVLIYPATHKIATGDPYYAAYDYYQRCCESAATCFAIGYSFRDYDALTKLRAGTSVNENLRLMLLAPDAAKVLAEVRIEEWRKIPPEFRFGEDASSYLSMLDDALRSKSFITPMRKASPVAAQQPKS